MQSAIRLARVEVQFDMFEALRQIAQLHDDVEVSVRVVGAGIAVRLYVGNGRTEHIFPLEQLRDSNVNILELEFERMVQRVKEYM